MKRNSIIYGCAFVVLTSCSMTKNISDDDPLFTGLKSITYVDEQRNDSFAAHQSNTKEEVEAALATVPNGSLFGSSYYTVPWSWKLWVYNHYSRKNSRFARWMTKSFGKAPVLMSQVNPALRASVAQSVLKNNGYFRSSVTYEPVPQKNPRKSKLSYTVRLDSLFTLDSVAYIGFPDTLMALIDSTSSEALIHKGSPFSVSALDGERTRISTLFRNNGYYYYNASYTSYLADTFVVDHKAQLQLKLAGDLLDDALRQWHIGRINVNFRKTMREQLTDSIHHRHLTISYQGKQSPIRPRVILKELRLRPRQLFSYANFQESASKINSTGVFSSTDFLFTPRDNDTLDLTLNCTFDKPYDFYIEGNAIGRTSGRYGPEVKVGFTKRNAFRGGEKLDVNLHGAYEWQQSGGADNSSYQYGADASIEFPRIIAPFYHSDRIRRDKTTGRPKPRHFYATPTTYAKVSSDVVRRPSYYKMHVATGEWTYRWQSSETSRHEFSPLTLKYQFKNSTTDKFDSVTTANPYLLATMDDHFIPKMRYTYTYTSPAARIHPVRWETTVEEAGNITSLWDLAGGHAFNEKEKTLFKNPYAQFLRLETDLTKTWTLTPQSSLVGHVNAGIIWSYGNSDAPPFSEQFYAGGANSIRAYTVRSIGPGAFTDGGLLGRQFSYLMRNGEMKLVANLEYRTPLFGNLQGAVFLDMGNVWNMKHSDFGTPDGDMSEEELALYQLFKMWDDDMTFSASRFLRDCALGTGAGLRYDLGFLVIRIDWGLALHCPYDTGKSGYFNINRFRDAHTLHFAIGYPF